MDNQDKRSWCSRAEIEEFVFAEAMNKRFGFEMIEVNPGKKGNRYLHDLVVLRKRNGDLIKNGLGCPGELKIERTPFRYIDTWTADAARRIERENWGCIFKKLGWSIPVPSSFGDKWYNVIAINAKDVYNYKYKPDQIVFIWVCWNSEIKIRDKSIPVPDRINKVYWIKFSDLEKKIKEKPWVHFYQKRPWHIEGGFDPEMLTEDEAKQILTSKSPVGNNAALSFYVDLADLEEQCVKNFSWPDNEFVEMAKKKYEAHYQRTR